MTLQAYIRLLLSLLRPRQQLTWGVSLLLCGYWVGMYYSQDIVLTLMLSIGFLAISNAHLFAIANQHQMPLTTKMLIEMGISTSLKGFLLSLGVMVALTLPLTLLGFVLQAILKPIVPTNWANAVAMIPLMLFLVGVLTSTVLSLHLNAGVATHNNGWRLSLSNTSAYFKHHRRTFAGGLGVLFVMWILPESFHCPMPLVALYQGCLCLLVNAALLHLQQFSKGVSDV